MKPNNYLAVWLVLMTLFARNPGTVAAQIHFRSWGGLGGRAGVTGQSGRGNRGSTGDVFSPDSRYLVARPDARTLELRDLENEGETITFHHDGAACFCRFSPDSRTLAVAVERSSGVGECEVVVWETGTRTRRHSLERDRRCCDLQFSRDGRLLVISTTYLNKGDPLNKTAVWDVETGRQLHELQTEEPNKKYLNPIMSLDQFSPDGRWLAACGFSGVSIWDARYWGRTRLFNTAVAVLPGGFSPDSRLVAATYGTRRAPMSFFGDGLAVWDVDKGKVVAKLPMEHAKNESAGGWPVFAPDGQSLAATVEVANPIGGKGRVERAVMLHWGFLSGKQTVLQTSPADTRYCSLFPPAFSPDGKLLAYVLWQPPPAIQFVDTRTWRPLRKLEMELAEDLSANPGSLPAQAFGVWFSPDGRWLAAARSVPEINECEAFLWKSAELK